MPSKLHTNNAELDETTVMDYNAPAKRSSLRHQTTTLSKEKTLSSRRNRSMKLQDKGKSLKIGVGVPSVSHHKPWPTSKVAGVEEVVKYMSDVPSYLQHRENGDHVQTTALNFGVLDWGRLEKWTYLQKQAANRRGGDSPSSSNASSSFCTFGSSSQSCRSSSSPVDQRKQSPPSDQNWNSPAEGCRIKMMEEGSSGQVTCFPDSRTSPMSTSVGRNLEKSKRKNSDMKGISCSKSESPDIGSSTSTSIAKSREAEKFQGREARDRLQDKLLAADVIWDDFQENVDCRRISLESTKVDNRKPEEVMRNSFSGHFPLEELHFTNLSPHCPYSGPLPSTSFAGTSLALKEEPTTNSKAKHEKHKQFAGNLVDRIDRVEAKANAAPQREGSPHHLASAGLIRMSRSSTLREGSSRQPIKQTCSGTPHEDKAAANGKGRRSPLRRMLDPLLKSKNRLHFSGPIASLPIDRAQELGKTDKFPEREELASAKGSSKSFDTSTNLSTNRVANSQSLVQGERNVGSRRQALLKLIWKNGLPLFMLSTSDNNILAATMGERSISGKNDFECLYTVFTAHEVKKKSGAWISQGEKSKRHGLVYEVVGQMKVSFAKLAGYDAKSHSIVREFVLFGAQLIPTTYELVNSLPNYELAAIVVKVPIELRESSCKDPLQTNSAGDDCCCREVDSLHVERNPENSSLSSIVAILPSGVHGSSSTGEPSTLIERWKSGGSCDCGGWDEGCMLTVLTNTGRTSRIDLSIQGGDRESRHSFCMDTLEEGLYTVEFGPSVALLQAFAISIATLHSREFNGFSRLNKPARRKSLQEYICSPISPAGRA